MRRRRQGRGATVLIMILMALVGLTGLLSGALARVLHDGVSTSAILGPATGIMNTPRATTPPTATSDPTPTVTSVTTTGQFDLSVSPNPRAVAPGAQITITVYAFTPDTHAPVAGLPCVLRSPQSGAALLSTWPESRPTDAGGQVSWVVTVPNESPGTYEVEAYCNSASAWSFRSDATVQVQG